MLCLALGGAVGDPLNGGVFDLFGASVRRIGADQAAAGRNAQLHRIAERSGALGRKWYAIATTIGMKTTA